MASVGAKENKKPQREFKKNVDGEDARRKREEMTIELRKNKREDLLNRRRQKTETGSVGRGAESPEKGPAQRTADMQEKLKAIPQLVQMLQMNDVAKQLEAVTCFRKLLSIERQPPIQEVIDAGVVNTFVQMLQWVNYPQIQFEAAWALTNIASGTSKHTKVIIDSGAVGMFVQLLKSPNEDVREQAVWALGNIAGDSHICRDLVLKCGALEPLLQLCNQSAKLTMIRNATWTISNFCRGKPQPPFELVRPALPTLCNLLYYKDDEVLTDACWALSYLSDDTGPHNQKIQAVVESGVVRRLVELLMHKSANVKTPALRTIGNIVTGDDMQTQQALQCSVLPCLLALLSNQKKGIRKETCWTISNITAGNSDQIQAVVDANLIPPLVNILKTAELDIQKEACWALSNATSGGSDDQIRYLVKQGVIPPLCALFNCVDPKIVLVAMEGIENILRVGVKDAPAYGGVNQFASFVEACGGLDALEALQKHDNEEIYDKSQKILLEFFESDADNEDESLKPTTDDTGNYGFNGSGSGSSGDHLNF